ncbi:ATP-binding protein [Tengunoibacter tsumagoiensis]|uniref:Circadian input-output histidine kinase CikA n=1 Tax=Tengunoibacter tsumagoiensis TaxID=2014871 RepID=A0A401ZYR7_9CHLR|nr:ATP-binding protein [Tengunoibacter tsumagoiensis]GCE11985.1 hypothetical protein KTT_18440 [Tengunoibacter tsumagoiensis]
MKNQMLISPQQQKQRLIEQLKRRLIRTISLLMFCFVLTSVIGIFAIVTQRQLGEQKVAIHSDVNVLLQAMIDQETGLRGYITTNNEIFLEPLTNGRSQYASTLQHIKEETAGSNFQSTSTVLTEVDDKALQWTNRFANPQIDTMHSGNLAAARDAQLNTEGKMLFDDFRRSVARLQTVTDNDLTNLQTQINLVDFGCLVGAIVLTVVAILWLWRTFNFFVMAQKQQLGELRDAAAAFGAGDFSTRVQNITDTDLYEVGHTFNTMADQLNEQHIALQDRDILEQVTQLNTILTDSLDLNELMAAFLKHALPLLDLQVGAFYLYNQEKQLLQLSSSQGLDRAQLQQNFTLGEGLVGRSAQERKPLFISQSKTTQTGSFQLKTLLGQVVPASMYHLPLIQGNELLGVLVIGSLYPMREQTRNVFAVLGSNISSSISNAQSYAHIRTQAQQLAEQSQAQARANYSLRQQRDELTALNAALEEANRARSRFLSTMSHELRTPLTSIIGFSQMLLRSSAKSPLNDRQTSNVDRILKNAQHLLTLINDVLDLAKVEAGRMDVNATETNLQELLTSLVEETRSMALERRTRVHIEVSDEVRTIETDPMKLRQIVLNLLSNALKFTEKGLVTIGATLRTTSATGGRSEAQQVAISVKDTGIGIPPDQQSKIFEAFYQIDNSNTRSYSGTGLGLSIVREFTTLLGGRVEIESEPGVGTTFTILLPLHARDRQSLQEVRLNTLHPASQRQTSEPRTTLSDEEDGRLVVAIDDNPDVLQLISASLEQSPYRVVGVQDSTQALKVIEELHPHAITLDIMMPKVNGWQILHQLKSNPATAAIPVILLTVLEDRSAGYVLGADEYLVKPVARDALLSTLQQLTTATLLPQVEAIEQTIGSTSVAPEEQELPHPFKHIMLVHNEQNIQELVDRLVQETGYHVSTINNGQDVIMMIEKASPDLLMLFVQLEQQHNNTSTLVVESQSHLDQTMAEKGEENAETNTISSEGPSSQDTANQPYQEQ